MKKYVFIILIIVLVAIFYPKSYTVAPHGTFMAEGDSIELKECVGFSTLNKDDYPADGVGEETCYGVLR